MNEVTKLTDAQVDDTQAYLLKATAGETGELWLELAKRVTLGPVGADEVPSHPVTDRDRETMGAIVANVIADLLAYADDAGLPLIQIEQLAQELLADRKLQVFIDRLTRPGAAP